MKEYIFMNPAGGTSIEQSLRRTLVQDHNGQQIKTAFVSTSSIAQGEQVGSLWKELFTKYSIKIRFCTSNIQIGNEAKGKAAVHVVIIHFSNFDVSNKLFITMNIVLNLMKSKLKI